MIFKDILCAFFAQQSLNNLFLEKQGVYLLVRWVPKEVQQGPYTPANAPQEQAPGLKNEASEH